MPAWFAALMGLVQGLTEFLPISSTAHLRITPSLFGRADPGAAFTAVIQFGTLAAVIIYFLPELWRMTRAVVSDRKSHDAKLAAYMIVGTLPIGVAGLLLRHAVEGSLRSLWVVAAALVVVAFVLVAADKLGRQERGIDELRLSDAIIIGLAQCFALIPGTSRSGATISAGLFIGLRRDAAARFSFLLSIPAVGAAGVLELRKSLHDLGHDALPSLAIATVVAGIVGYLTIAWLMRFLRTRSLVGFAAYRLILGGVLVVLLVTHVVKP